MKVSACRSPFVVVLAAMAALLAACGDGDDVTTTPTVVDGSGDQVTEEAGPETDGSGDPATDGATDDPAGDGAAGDETPPASTIVVGADDGADRGEGNARSGDAAAVDGDGGADGDVDGDGDGVVDGDGDGGAAPATAPAFDVGSLTGAELEAFLARRYEDFWLAFGEARERPSATPAVDFPSLADLAVGEQLESAYAELADMAETGRALRVPAERAVPGVDHQQSHRIRVATVEGGSAQLVACHVNDRESYQVADGAVISDLVVTVKAEATMVLADGTWKLVRSQAVALDPGVGGCWLEDESLYPW
ncbi:MAG: hypothetical protein AAGA93_24460 [Actinomycetota bacterium]